MTDEEYDQELECSFEAAVLGTYYAKLMLSADAEGRITSVPWEPEFEVEVSTDLGFSDSSAFWFWQYRPDGVALFDYEEEAGKPLEFYFQMLKDKGYKYKTIWLPHDARAKTLQTGRSTIEQFLKAGFPVEIAPTLKVQHGIDAARFMLPKCWFDGERCDDGIEALKAYRRKYDEVTKSFSDNPHHDWASNSADSFRYFALVSRDKYVKVDEEKRPTRGLFKQPEYRLDDLFKQREDSMISRFHQRVH
jgi:hypothetical protein